MKQFGSIAKKAAQQHQRDEEDYLEYTIVDRKMKFYYPGSGALAYIALTEASAANELQRSGAYINFVISLLSDEDARHIKGLLLDHASGFDIEDLTELIDELMDQWSAENPTKRGSDSSPTSPPPGRPSTAASRRAGSTRSTSRSTASSTRPTTS